MSRGRTAKPNRSHRLCPTNTIKTQNERTSKPACLGKLSENIEASLSHSLWELSSMLKVRHWIWERRQRPRASYNLRLIAYCPCRGPALYPCGQHAEVALRRKQCLAIHFCRSENMEISLSFNSTIWFIHWLIYEIPLLSEYNLDLKMFLINSALSSKWK